MNETHNQQFTDGEDVTFGVGANKKDIYNRSIEVAQTGDLHYIREESDPTSGETLSRKYFSDGFFGKNLLVLLVTGAVLIGAIVTLPSGSFAQTDQLRGKDNVKGVAPAASDKPQQKIIDRQEEVALVWKSVMNQLKDIAALKKMIDSKEAFTHDDRKPIKITYALIFEDGHLRLVNDTDRSLAPNHYVELRYEKDMVHQTWRVMAFDNQNFKRKVVSSAPTPQNATSQVVFTKYLYDDNFFSGYLAKSAEAYRGEKLVARADAIRKLTDSTPYQMEVSETHYDDAGKVTYKGIIVLSLGQYGKVVRETKLSGFKRQQFFDSWGTGE